MESVYSCDMSVTAPLISGFGNIHSPIRTSRSANDGKSSVPATRRFIFLPVFVSCRVFLCGMYSCEREVHKY